MIKQLKIKLILINMVLITIVLVITFVAVYLSTNEQIVRDTNMVMQRMLENREFKEPPKREIGRAKPDFGGKNNEPFTLIASFSIQLDMNQEMLTIENNNILVVDEAVLDEMVADCLESGRPSGILYKENFRYLMAKNELGTKIAFADRTEEIARLTSLLSTSALVGCGSLLAFFFISLYLARWAVKPIAKSLEQQHQFVADASHELKTPLTVILANTNIILTHKDSKVIEQQKWIEYIKTEAERMTTLVNNLLFLAKADNTKNDAVFQHLNFSDTVWSCILPFESVAFEQDKAIDSSIQDNIFLTGDEGKLKQLVVILVDNAIKYTGDKGLVTISLSSNQDKITFSVNNTGDPIPEDQFEHIFKRFYRIDKSRAREKSGYGLGLAIAQSIVTTHHGKIAVTSNAQTGTTFTVTMPKGKE